MAEVVNSDTEVLPKPVDGTPMTEESSSEEEEATAEELQCTT